jgi:hypothetical protein
MQIDENVLRGQLVAVNYLVLLDSDLAEFDYWISFFETKEINEF